MWVGGLDWTPIIKLDLLAHLAVLITWHICTQTAKHGHGHKGLDQTMLAQWVWPQVQSGSCTIQPKSLKGERALDGSRLLPLQAINIWGCSAKALSNTKRKRFC